MSIAVNRSIFSDGVTLGKLLDPLALAIAISFEDDPHRGCYSKRQRAESKGGNN
jgi:hypothetical protein